MAPNFFQKPETALKRAQELIQVGKEQDALDTLHDTIKARRHKQWTQVHEQIMYKHLELCVTLRKPHVAKDALFQYKGLTQQVAVDSLERVIEFFLKLAETKTEEAQKTSIEKVEEIDDLDQGDNPETLLLSVVSGAAAQDRMDRTVLSPWLRFLWDSYRNCLELLRNNSQVEQLYHRITRKSFGFCSRYQRRAEFRKLCDLLRLHLNQIQKNQHMSHVVKLNSAESLTLMQETRLCQLDTAIQMELWQEAYRSAEDVHGMMQLSKDRDKRMVKASSYVNYYDKLALVFWKAGNRLFHAAALLQKFIIYKDMKKSFTSEEALDQATRVLLATLSIPDGADAPSDLTRHLDIEDQHMCNIRLLSNLLRLPISPTRNGILKECARLGVPEMANEQARNLYRLLENNFAPLRLASDTEVELTKVDKPEYEQYVESLRYVIATKALKQIAVIYDSITWTRVRKMIPFFDEETLERFLVDVSKHRIVKAQLDHRSGCVRFGAADATLAGGVDLEDADGFTGDDTQLGVEGIRSHLELMYNKLRSIVESLDSDDMKKEAVDRVKQHAQIYDYHKKTDYERVMMRRRKIENYKETSERAKAEKNQAAEAERARREEQKRAEEMKRLELENQETEKKRRLAEQEEVQRKIRQDQLKKMQNTPLYHAIIKELGEDAFKDMDPEQVLLEQRQRLDAERQAMQQRLQQQEKKFDHHIRALHLEEMIERRSIMQRRLAEAPKLHAEYEERRVTKAIADHEDQVQTYARLEAVAEDSADWIASVKEDRADDFAKKVEEWQNKLDAVRSARLKERAEERKRRRREEWLQHQAMLERRRKEEEERQKQAIIDEQRRAGREARGEPMRRRDDYDSKAMGDSDWRSGPRSDAPRAERPAFDRERSGPGGPPRGGGFERRERENVPPSVADNDSSWRAGPRAAPAPSSSAAPPYRPGMGLSRRDDPPAPSREDFGTAMRRPAAPISRPTPASAGASDGAWSRGNVVKKEAPAPAPAPAPAAGGADKSGPWRPSFRKEGDAPAGPGGAAPSNRPAAPNPRAIGRPAAPAPKGPGADADRNWRR